MYRTMGRICVCAFVFVLTLLCVLGLPVPEDEVNGYLAHDMNITLAEYSTCPFPPRLPKVDPRFYQLFSEECNGTIPSNRGYGPRKNLQNYLCYGIIDSTVTLCGDSSFLKDKKVPVTYEEMISEFPQEELHSVKKHDVCEAMASVLRDPDLSDREQYRDMANIIRDRKTCMKLCSQREEVKSLCHILYHGLKLVHDLTNGIATPQVQETVKIENDTSTSAAANTATADTTAAEVQPFQTSTDQKLTGAGNSGQAETEKGHSSGEPAQSVDRKPSHSGGSLPIQNILLQNASSSRTPSNPVPINLSHNENGDSNDNTENKQKSTVATQNEDTDAAAKHTNAENNIHKDPKVVTDTSKKTEGTSRTSPSETDVGDAAETASIVQTASVPASNDRPKPIDSKKPFTPQEQKKTATTLEDKISSQPGDKISSQPVDKISSQPGDMPNLQPEDIASEDDNEEYNANEEQTENQKPENNQEQVSAPDLDSNMEVPPRLKPIAANDNDPALTYDYDDRDYGDDKANPAPVPVNNKMPEASIKIAFSENEDSHFFAYFLTLVVLGIIGYLVFHNKQKIIALVIEGRRVRGSRRRPSTAGYRKLDNTLEEAITSSHKGSPTNIIY